MSARQTSECRKAVNMVIATGCTPAHAASKLGIGVRAVQRWIAMLDIQTRRAGGRFADACTTPRLCDGSGRCAASGLPVAPVGGMVRGDQMRCPSKTKG